MSPKKSITVGITFGWDGPDDSIFSRGVGQTCFFLKCLLEKIPEVKEVVFVQNHPLGSPRPVGLLTEFFHNSRFIDIQQAYQSVDVFIEGLFYFEKSTLEQIHKLGKKVICFYVGANYVIDAQCFLSNNPNPYLHLDAELYDGAWMFPHIEFTSGDYLALLHRKKVEVVPYIWDPFFVNLLMALSKKEGFGYTPHPNPKRVVIMEPNSNFSKLFLIPLSIAEKLERSSPNLIESVSLLNTKRYSTNSTFNNLLSQLDLYKKNKLKVEGKYPFPLYMQNHCDLLLTHQFGLERNNVYFEMLYGCFPLVHNSEHLRSHDVGYFYPDFCIDKGAKSLEEAILFHDKNLAAYKEKARSYLIEHAPFNPKNIEAYREKLLSVME